ncbi:MAG TPA: thiamine-phosphate kinase [Candidatus Binatia bacterium]|jgi:thiamine-monophosphate kinase
MTDRLRDRGEQALLEAIRHLIPESMLTSAGVHIGPGDDAAVLAPRRDPLLLTTDAMVEGVHFRRPWLSPHALGRRAFEVSASDVAAMGGTVVGALLAVAAPPKLPARDLRAIVAGVRDGARAAGGALVGGNLASADVLSLTVTVLGVSPAKPVTRAGGRAGDQLFVTGTLGGAALGVRTLSRRGGRGSAAATRWWREPRARLRAGAVLARRRLATAMIDVSDGLLIDAERLCAASGVAGRIDADRLPLPAALRRVAPAQARALALGGGEDYELLFAVPPARVAVLRAARAALGCPLTHVGELRAGRGVAVTVGGRTVQAPGRHGHEHFRFRRGASG